MLTKNELRQKYQSTCIDFLNQHNKAELDQAVCWHLSKLISPGVHSTKSHLPLTENIQTVASFKSLASEPNLQNLSQLCDQKLSWVYPKVSGETLNFYQSQDFQKSSLGIQEPLGGAECPIEQIDLFLVPGVAFSRSGQRLGRGKAFYDKTLKNNKSKKIGVGFFCQLMSDEISNEVHDIDMDFIVTERGVIKCKQL